MYVPNDADVKRLLKEMKVDPEHAGAKTESDRLRLLQRAMQKAQDLDRFLRKAADSSSSGGGSSSSNDTTTSSTSNSAAKTLDLRSLKSIKSRGPIVAKEFDMDRMYSIQEKLAIQHGLPEIETAWFEARRTLCKVIEQHIEEGTKRLHLVDNTEPHKLGGVIDFMGARVTADGKVPVLETRHCFYYTHQMTQAYVTVESSTNPPGPRDCVIMEVEPEEMKLLAVLLDINAGCLSPAYVSACESCWGTGSHLTPSFLLPLEPLTSQVHLPQLCAVCGTEGANACSACRTIAYCSKACQKADWKQHKKACKEAQAAQSSSGTSVIVDLAAAVPDAPFVATVPTNTSSRNLQKAAQAGPSESHAGAAEGVAAHPAKRFVVKVQAPLVGPGGMGMPLYLYDERRQIVAYINSRQQPTFDSLLHVIRQKGVMGAKLYCWATLDTRQQLRVSTDPLPSQTHSW